MTTTSNKNLQDLYRDATEYLDGEYAYFLTHILNIGKPTWNGGIPTAAVVILDKNVAVKDYGDAFEFVFNPEFAKSLSADEMGFVLAHETLHIVLNHLKLGKRFDDAMRFNIAADCMINDYLNNMGLTPMEGLCRGKDIVGYDCANATVTEVYADIKPQKCGTCDGSGEKGEGKDGEPCSDCGGSGEASGGGYGKYSDAKAIDDHDWIHNPVERDATEQKIDDANAKNKIPDVLERTAQDDAFRSQVPGSGIGGRQSFIEKEGVGLKWADLLAKVNPFMFRKGPKPRPSWHRRPRKLAALPDVNLPVTQTGIRGKGGEQPAIVMALDTSGSIGESRANEFVNLARSVPTQKIKLFVCTFTMQYQELDLDNPEWSSGGTRFDPITDFINDKVIPVNRGRYPKAVVVVTDGYAQFGSGFPTGNEDAWWWLITEGGGSFGGKALPGHQEELKDYVARKGTS